MLTAFAYPDPEKGGRGRKGEATKAAEKAGFSATRLLAARKVLHYSRAMALQAIGGAATMRTRSAAAVRAWRSPRPQ